MRIVLTKAGTNPDQRPTAVIAGPYGKLPEGLSIGDVFHVTGQPLDVKWRITAFDGAAA